MIDLKGAFERLDQRAGQTWYVNALTGVDANSGKSPRDPFLTIGAAVNVAISGDCIKIAEGTYDEAISVPAAQNGLEIVCEPGVILSNTTPGTVMMIAADNVKVTGNPKLMQAGQVGAGITGDDFYGEMIAIGCAQGFLVTGARVWLKECWSIQHTTTGFDIEGVNGFYDRCVALGTAATRGFYLQEDRNLVRKCTSMDNTAGAYECTGAANECVIDHCSQSELCGGPIDAGANNSWVNLNEESQIAIGNTIQQDWADIHTLVSAIEARSLFTMDFWSLPEDAIDVDDGATDIALPDVVVAGLPSGATIERAVAMFKFRMIEETSGGVNALDGAQEIQVRDDSPSAWIDAINLIADQFTLAANAREGGDVCIGAIDISATVDGNDTYNFQWDEALADADDITFNDIQVGIRIWFSI